MFPSGSRYWSILGEFTIALTDFISNFQAFLLKIKINILSDINRKRHNVLKTISLIVNTNTNI